MTSIARLKNHRYAQCYTITYPNGDITFVSYRTPIIYISHTSEGKRLIQCTGTYSQTTRKQIGWFLKEYLPEFSYYDMKNIVGKGWVEM